MIVNPGIRRFLGSAIQRLFNSASVSLPLTHTAIPTRGSITPTFTRATTATFTDWEGVLRTVPAGCARFEGARMVRNLTKTNSEDFGVAFTTVNGGNSASGTTLTFAGGLNTYILQSNNTGIIAGRTYCYSVYLKAGTKAGTIKFGNQTNGEFSAPITPTATLTRYQFTNISAGPGFVGFVNSTADTGTVIAERFQIEDVTGQADQTASEYVSVGVESAPYHGAGVDGVEFFDTDRDGNLLSPQPAYLAEGARTNAFIYANDFSNAAWVVTGTPTPTKNIIGTDGAVSAWTITDNDGAASEYITQNVTLTAAVWTMSARVKKTTGAQASYPGFFGTVGTTIAICTIDTSNGVATAWTAYTGFSIAAGLTCRCTSYSTDYWLVEMTFTGTAAAWAMRLAPAITTNATQSTGVIDPTAQGSAVFERAQLELGSFASTYVPTTTVAVMRNADDEQYPTSGNITAAAGWVSIEYTPQHEPSGTVFLWGTYVDADNYTAVLHDATNLIFRKRIAATNYDATIANAFATGLTYKMAATWGASGTAIALDGVIGTPHANTTAAQIGTVMEVGGDGNSLQQPFFAESNVRIGQRALSSSELQAITS